MSLITNLLVSFLLWSTYLSLAKCDEPCAARDVGIEGRSIVCVCNATYCDTISREIPERGKYVIYTSSFAGDRFKKSYGDIETEVNAPEDDNGEDVDEVEDENDNNKDGEDGETEQPVSILNRASIRLYANRRFQVIEGFGGSVTDAASINWRKLSDGAQIKFINTYFGKDGIEYNLIRVPIGGSDFSEYPYTYNEGPWQDGSLSNYSIVSEDIFFKLPMIKRALRAATSEIKITASTWSPPVWMKTNERITGYGQLKPEYYQTYADYHLRFLEEYSKAEVPIWAITTTNEPINGVAGAPLVRFNSLGWFPSQLARWVNDNLGPTIRQSRFNATKILAIDDQRYMLPVYIYGMEQEEPKAFDYIDGFAIHYYGNFAPASILTAIQNNYPNKILLSTEACEGPMPWDNEKVEIGSWQRANNYVTSILQDLNNYVVGWIDWNLCLSPTGGPNWADNFVDAPILVYENSDEFIKQPMYYGMGHFSKFIPRGSRRIRSAQRSLLRIENLAVLTPEGTVVVVLQNTRERAIDLKIQIDWRRFVSVTLEPQSIKTIEIGV